MKEQGKLIPEQGKKTKGQGNGQGEPGSLISPRKYDFSIDKIDRREVHLHQLQSLMKCAANGGLEPKPTGAARHANVCTLGERPLIGASGSIYRGFPEIFLFLLHALRCWSAHKGSCLQLLRCETD